jgi:hypothetical protein
MLLPLYHMCPWQMHPLCTASGSFVSQFLLCGSALRGAQTVCESGLGPASTACGVGVLIGTLTHCVAVESVYGEYNVPWCASGSSAANVLAAGAMGAAGPNGIFMRALQVSDVVSGCVGSVG